MTSKVCLSCHPFSCSYNISVITSAYHIPCNVDWRQIWVLMYSEVIILIKCYSDVSHIYGICFNLSYLVGVDVFSPLWNMQNAEIKYCKYIRLICKSTGLSVRSSKVQPTQYPMSNSSLQQMLRKHQTRQTCSVHFMRYPSVLQ